MEVGLCLDLYEFGSVFTLSFIYLCILDTLVCDDMTRVIWWWI